MKIYFSNQTPDPAGGGNRCGMTLVEVVVALAIAGLMIAGIISGYIFCTACSTKDSLGMAANARAAERLEEARSARWDTSSYPPVDQLVPANFPDVAVTLDRPASDPLATLATLKTDISLIATSPPLKKIHVDCVWLFRGSVPVTNSIETCRAPDQ